MYFIFIRLHKASYSIPYVFDNLNTPLPPPHHLILVHLAAISNISPSCRDDSPPMSGKVRMWKRDSSPSPHILLLQDIDIVARPSGQLWKGLAGYFHSFSESTVAWVLFPTREVQD